jgi:leucyl-tRNA synthetase
LKYDFPSIEKKWAQAWIDKQVFTPDLEKAEKPYYALFMFPYPSAEGLHIGNFYSFTCTDVMAKYKKLQGYDVFEPVGFDAFGIHSENYALKIGETPRRMLARTMANFRKQMIEAGLGCDWTRTVDTTSPEYYKWTQWIFAKLFESDLAYRKEALLNWCPECKTVLADEQIEDGKCERCGTLPEKKRMKQWFLRITRYADRLLEGLSDMDWSDITKSAQSNWIGRSEGAELDFKVCGHDSKIKVFTTRPDTLFGATYIVLSPEHELALKITASEKQEEVKQYIRQAGARSDLERIEAKEKTGVFTHAFAVNPINNKEIPIWIADYVLTGYGTGAIMAVPAHDVRDYEFAKKFDLPVVEVLSGGDISKEAFTGDGVLVNSDFLNGLDKESAIKKMTRYLTEKGLGQGVVHYKLRDWCLSRQRYWGPPVPVVYCEKCGVSAVPEKDLPVLLPELDQGWEPAGDGRGPLAKVKTFMQAKCPGCKGPAEREADVMDNFMDSAWYFFRYLSPLAHDHIFDSETGKKWLPVDLYVGGNEHAVLHLMYTRFITMALHDLGLIHFDNPFKRFRANGMIQKDGKKMSKSKGNVIRPEEYGKKVGYDALKTYLLFLGPLSENRSFTDEGVQGAMRWAERVYNLSSNVYKGYTDDIRMVKKLHQTIKRVEDDFEDQKYNTAVAHLMELTNTLSMAEKISTTLWQKCLPLFAPFLPALTEELWQNIGKKESIFAGLNWPVYEPDLAREEKINLVAQVNGKVRVVLEVPADISEDSAKKAVLGHEVIKKWLEGKSVVKVIYIQKKLVNIVVR